MDFLGTLGFNYLNHIRNPYFRSMDFLGTLGFNYLNHVPNPYFRSMDLRYSRFLIKPRS